MRHPGPYDDRSVSLDIGRRRSYTTGDVVFYLVGVAGLTFALTCVWLGMRSVMDIGGYCASGGPYEVATTCPAGVDVIMTLAFPLGFLSAGLMLWKGSRLGDPYAGLVALAWPALFLSLGWNFLEYALRAPGGGGVELGWLIPGVIFIIMGGVPLLGWIGARGHGHVVPGVAATRTPIELNELSRAMRQVVATAGRSGGPTVDVGAAMRLAGSKPAVAPGAGTGGGGTGSAATGGTGAEAASSTPDSLVTQLERLAALHSSGALSDEEYDTAKQALLAAASRGQLG